MTTPPTEANGGVPTPAGLARREGRVIVAAHDAATLCTPLRADDVAIHAVTDVGRALAMLRGQEADVLVLDWDDPAYGAAAACAAVRADPRLAATWILGVVDRWARATVARREGADDVIVRPLQAPEIAARARLGVEAARDRASDHLLRTLMTHVPGVLYRSAWDRGYTVELISDEIERITGYPASDFVESRRRTLLSIMHPDDAESVMARAAEATDGRSFVLEYRLVCADGSVRWMVDRGQLVRGPADRLWMDGVIVDVTDLREAEHALRREAVEHARVEELRASRARIVAAADAARRRIERDLHDGAQQRLVTLRLQLSLARRRIETDPESAGAMMDEVGEELRLALAELRELARGIHPPTLSERGLRPAVEALASRCPLPVEVEELPRDRFGPAVEAAAYFTISEALTNVAKYASAGYATVRGAVEHDALIVEVRDDGVGGADAAGGSGLTGLADRVRAQGGTLAVVSPAGAGTTVRAVIPLDGAARLRWPQ
jgi:PAS domain S-box-containing protein